MIEVLAPKPVVAKWTQFKDMNSGGSKKVEVNGKKIGYIYIEADEATACRIFEARFGRNPLHETCSCCGGDYSIHEADSLEAVSAYERDCKWSLQLGGYDLDTAKIPLEEYIQGENVLVIYRSTPEVTDGAGA